MMCRFVVQKMWMVLWLYLLPLVVACSSAKPPTSTPTISLSANASNKIEKLDWSFMKHGHGGGSMRNPTHQPSMVLSVAPTSQPSGDATDNDNEDYSVLSPSEMEKPFDDIMSRGIIIDSLLLSERASSYIAGAPTTQPSTVQLSSIHTAPPLKAGAARDTFICNTADPFNNLSLINENLIKGDLSLDNSPEIQPVGHPSVTCSAPTTHPSVAPSFQPAHQPSMCLAPTTQPSAPSKSTVFKVPAGQPTMTMISSENRSPPSFTLWGDHTSSSAPSIQPTTIPASSLFARQSPTPSSLPLIPPELSLRSIGRIAWAPIIRGDTPSLVSQAQSSCFVSTFPWSKVKQQKQTMPPGPRSLNNNFFGHEATMPQPRQILPITLGAGRGDNYELVNTNPTNKNQLQILPLLMYGVVPFIPSTLLSTLNDQYRTTKEQFNTFSTSLPPNVPTDSAEYLSLSTMYNETMQSLFVLLLSKRLALYFLATLATTYAGWRAASTGVVAVRDGGFGGPGEALDCLNREVLKGANFDAMVANSGKGLDGGKDIIDKKSDEDQLFATLVDDNPNQSASSVGNGLAVALPLVLGASLTFSYLLTTLQTAGDQVSSPGTDAIQELLLPALPYLLPLPSAVLCLLFVATEFRWILPPANDATKTSITDSAPLLCTANILAVTYIAGAYAAKINPTIFLNGMPILDLWPLQNGVNFALAATVSRALSPFLLSSSMEDDNQPEQSESNKSIRTVALALVGLTLFDAISTFGIVANAADTVDTAATAVQSQSMSVMESVARSKLASWQPGLLEIILGHDNSKVTEALGLGDVVFPSILVAWGFAADKEVLVVDNDEGGNSGGFTSYYASASIVGYVFGSFVTEIVGSFALLGNRAGLPALVFLVPSMLAAVTLMAWSRDELGDVWGK